MNEVTGYTLVGNQLTALIEATDSTIDVDREGITVASVKYTGLWTTIVVQAIAVVTHPDYPALTRTTLKLARLKGGMATATVSFEGVIYGGQIYKKYNLKGATSSEPIEAHPDFTTFAGDPMVSTTNPDTGAMWDKDGKFKGFKVEGAGDNFYNSEAESLAGVKSYLVPGLVYTEVAVFAGNTVPTTYLEGGSVVGLGSVSTPPRSIVLPSPVSPDTTNNWLIVGHDVDEVGQGVRIVRRWRLSGKHGWNPLVYPKTTPPVIPEATS